MIDVLKYLLVAEMLGALGLPLSQWAFRALPDRGLTISKTVVLVIGTWICWLVGFPTGWGGSTLLIVIVFLVIGGIGWGIGRRAAWQLLRESWRYIAVVEGIFISLFVLWAIVRSLNPAISGTEKPMDMMFLQAAFHVSVSPVQDLWLAGHGANYYYFGYLTMANFAKVAGVSVPVAYNLSLALIIALAVTSTYGIIFNLTRSRMWAALGPLFVVLSSNAFVLVQQIAKGQFPWTQYYWFFSSSRVVGANGATINEYPLFSFVLGDLHPHVMSIPLVLVTISSGLAITLDRNPAGHFVTTPIRLVLFSVVVGSLFATNTWDYPTFLLLNSCTVAIAAWNSGNRELWLGRAGLSILVIAGTSLVAFAPFILRYTSPTSGFGFVTTTTAFPEFAEVFGLAGIVVLGYLILVIRYALRFRPPAPNGRRPSTIETGPARKDSIASEAVIAAVAFGILAVILGVTGHLVLLLVLIVIGVTARMLLRSLGLKAVGTQEQFVLLLIGIAALVLGVTETIYLRDGFSGSYYYRMNTVFKFYYQAWILLGLAAAYAAWRGTQLLPARVWTAIWAVPLAAGLPYLVLGPLSYAGGGPTLTLSEQGLDGSRFLASGDPADYYAIQWLRSHETGEPLILEATGGAYTLFGRVSVFTGLPTLLGWADHEYQWRGVDPLITQRHHLIDEIYSTSKTALAISLLKKAKVSLVYVGPCEREVYARGPNTCDPRGGTPYGTPTVQSGRDALTKFGHFMRTIYAHDGVRIYAWHSSSSPTS